MVRHLQIDKIFERNVPNSRNRLSKRTVGIAGCGGLGSNVAVALTRAGVGKLVLVDPDIVELSNLNRQYYFLKDVGKKKIMALTTHLLNINPELLLETADLALTNENMIEIFKDVDLLIEGLDLAESKSWLIETWCTCFPGKPIVCGNGVAGLGKTSSITVHRSGQIIICGDFESDMRMGLTSARVAIVANMQANEAIDILLRE